MTLIGMPIEPRRLVFNTAQNRCSRAILRSSSDNLAKRGLDLRFLALGRRFLLGLRSDPSCVAGADFCFELFDFRQSFLGIRQRFLFAARAAEEHRLTLDHQLHRRHPSNRACCRAESGRTLRLHQFAVGFRQRGKNGRQLGVFVLGRGGRTLVTDDEPDFDPPLPPK